MLTIVVLKFINTTVFENIGDFCELYMIINMQ